MSIILISALHILISLLSYTTLYISFSIIVSPTFPLIAHAVNAYCLFMIMNEMHLMLFYLSVYSIWNKKRTQNVQRWGLRWKHTYNIIACHIPFLMVARGSFLGRTYISTHSPVGPTWSLQGAHNPTHQEVFAIQTLDCTLAGNACICQWTGPSLFHLNSVSPVRCQTYLSQRRRIVK